MAIPHRHCEEQRDEAISIFNFFHNFPARENITCPKGANITLLCKISLFAPCKKYNCFWQKAKNSSTLLHFSPLLITLKNRAALICNPIFSYPTPLIPFDNTFDCLFSFAFTFRRTEYFLFHRLGLIFRPVIIFLHYVYNRISNHFGFFA